MKLNGKKILKARNKAGLSQLEAGKRLSINRSLLSKYEKGIITNIGVDRLEQLADLYGVDVSEFFVFCGNENILKSNEDHLKLIKKHIDVLEQQITDLKNRNKKFRREFMKRRRSDDPDGFYPAELRSYFRDFI